MRKELTERKLRNMQTSVSFGSTNVLYESDAMSRQRDILGAPSRGPDEKRNQELKQALTRTHLTFGDDPVVYQRTSRLPDPTGRLSDYTGVLNTEVKDMIKSTSVSFGNEPTVYRSMAFDQMDIKMPEGASRKSQLESNRELKMALTRSHLNFGEEDTDWTTDYQRGFQFDKEKAQQSGSSVLAKEVKADLCRTHFTMGNHTLDWETDSMRTQRVGNGTMTTPEERYAQFDKNRALKKQLQSTHYQIGTDEDYM